MKMLRSITDTHHKKGQDQHFSDRKILANFLIPSVRIRCAKERLCYGFRLHQNAATLLEPAIRCESEVTDYSWLAGFHADLEWFTRLEGSSWGQTFDEIKVNWQQGNWKKAVKRALEKHVYQEVLAVTSESKVFSPLPCTSPAVEVCECGKAFGSKKALSVHRWQIHGAHAFEYHHAQNPLCPICLRYFWTIDRNRQHLTYIPRRKKPNYCFAWFETFFPREELVPTNEAEHVELMPGHKGLNRRDAIRAFGPHVFGFHVRDLEWAQNEIERLECYFETFLEGVTLDDVLDRAFQESFDATMAASEDAWHGGLLQVLEDSQKSQFECAFNLTLWWGRFSWDDFDARDQCAELIVDYFSGRELLDWFSIKKRLSDALLWRQQDPHRPVYSGPANEPERISRDSKIELRMHQMIERATEDLWTLVEAKVWDAIIKVLQPSSTVAGHRRVVQKVLSL